MRDRRHSYVSGEEAMMQLHPGVTALNEIQFKEMRRELERNQIPTYVIAMSGSRDRAAFFRAVKDTLPLDPPLASSGNWDALLDSLWSGLDSLGVDRVALLWPNSAAFRSVSPEDFDVAVSVLDEIAKTLLDPSVTEGSPTELSVYLEGLGVLGRTKIRRNGSS
jgi:hypothetical protein